MHKIAQKSWSEGIFKAYDIRGKYPEEINDDAVYKIARAFARYLRLGVQEKKDLKILVSTDARISSPALKEAFLDGLLDENVEIIDAGLTTTPMHYFVLNQSEADGGAMITASHNPAEFNGIKLSRKGAVPIGEGTGMEEIKADALRGIFMAAPPTESADSESGNRGKVFNKDFLEDYIQFFKNKFSDLAGHGIKFTACAGNGMTSILLHELFGKFPKFKVGYLHDDLDMSFPNHEANPLKEENLRDVQWSVLKNKSALGISFDGDGDRVGFVDEAGKFIPGDIVTALLVEYFSNYQATPDENSRRGRAVSPSNSLNGGRDGVKEFSDGVAGVVYDLRSSRVVREGIEKYGMRPIESRVGHAFMKKLMRDNDAILGGELSGHYYFRDFFFCDSAIFTILAMLDLLRLENKPLSELVRPLLRYVKSNELNYEVQDKERLLDKVVSYFPDAQIFYLDGIKVEYWDSSALPGKKWWFNLRISNTEDLVRLNLEADNKELFEEKKKLVEELLSQ